MERILQCGKLSSRNKKACNRNEKGKAQTDDDWEDWGLEQLVENLWKYVCRNSINFEDKQPDRERKSYKSVQPKNDYKLYSAITKTKSVIMIRKAQRRHACTLRRKSVGERKEGIQIPTKTPML